MKSFDRCPSCGSTDTYYDGMKKFSCKKCSFTYYHNVAAAAAVILKYEDKIVLVRRSREPGKGKLDLPGGFLDPGETAEEGVKREISEELHIDIGTAEYLGSCPNVYEYKGVVYNTCDLFFYSRIDKLPTSFDKTEVQEVVLIDPSEIPIDEIAFESTKTALRLFGPDL
jgi:NAD+ diphosphatase